MVVKTIKVPIYGTMLHIAMTENFEEDLEAFNKKFKDTLTIDDIKISGFAQQRGNHILILLNIGRLKKKHKEGIEVESEIVATIVHEAVHACNIIFQDRGVELDLNNDEPQAYFTDWIAQEVFKVYFKSQEE